MDPTPDVLTIRPALHPKPVVRKVGFDLDHPYVEQCWSGVVGPTSVLLLRRVPLLWRDATPAHVRVSELARSLGLTGPTGPGSRFWQTVRRMCQFGLARPAGGGTLDVFTRVAPLTSRQLARLPDWSVRAHDGWMQRQAERLSEVATPGRTPAASITARLDRLEHRPSPDVRTLGR